MFWLDQFDLTRRWGDRVPTWLVRAIVTVAMTAVGIVPRVLIGEYWPQVSPVALIYPAVLLGTLLAGWRAGLATVVLSQTFVWALFMRPIADDAISLGLTSFAQLFMVFVVSAFRRASRRAAELEEARADTLALALRELDHRTKNNFMLAAALLRIQSAKSGEPQVKAELDRASDRLLSMESVQSNLAVASADIELISLKSYLEDLCERLQHGLFHEHVAVSCDVEDAELPRDVAVPLGLIANELITNALKHAFGPQGGKIWLHGRCHEGHLTLDVADDGCGKAGRKSSGGGVGTRLVRMLVGRIGATMEELPGPGTRYRIELPLQSSSALSGVSGSARRAGSGHAPAITSARP